MSTAVLPATDDVRALAAALRPTARLSAYLLDQVLDEIEGGGPVRDLLIAHPASAEPMVVLRLMAAVSVAQLAGKAPELDPFVNSLPAGASEERLAWEAFRAVLLRERTIVDEALSRPVQQHEPWRGQHLLRGLSMLGAARVRLLELGACAGLNLLVDRYRWCGDGWAWGDEASGVIVRAAGQRPGPVDIVERAGCDLAPRDPTSLQDVQILTSFVPFEARERRAELVAALALAAQEKPNVEAADAVGWLEAKLREPVDADTTTVVWHSLFLPYLDGRQQHEIELLMQAAAQLGDVARITFEPAGWQTVPRLQVSVYR